MRGATIKTFKELSNYTISSILVHTINAVSILNMRRHCHCSKYNEHNTPANVGKVHHVLTLEHF